MERTRAIGAEQMTEHEVERIKRKDYKQGFKDGAKAEWERILKRLDDADCQCCGDTERIKAELSK